MAWSARPPSHGCASGGDGGFALLEVLASLAIAATALASAAHAYTAAFSSVRLAAVSHRALSVARSALETRIASPCAAQAPACPTEFRCDTSQRTIAPGLSLVAIEVRVPAAPESTTVRLSTLVFDDAC